MIRIARVYPSACVMAVAAFLSGAACVPAHPVTPLPIDLLRELPRAAQAPAADAPRLIVVKVVDHQGASKPALVMHATSRVIWQVQMTDAAELKTDMARLPGGDPAADLTVRLGMSDGRLYEDVYRGRLAGRGRDAPAWQPLAIDLAPYSGWKWSIFNQPARRIWSLILNVQGGDAEVAFVEPRIEARMASRF